MSWRTVADESTSFLRVTSRISCPDPSSSPDFRVLRFLWQGFSFSFVFPGLSGPHLLLCPPPPTSVSFPSGLFSSCEAIRLGSSPTSLLQGFQDFDPFRVNPSCRFAASIIKEETFSCPPPVSPPALARIFDLIFFTARREPGGSRSSSPGAEPDRRRGRSESHHATDRSSCLGHSPRVVTRARRCLNERSSSSSNLRCLHLRRTKIPDPPAFGLDRGFCRC